MKNHFFAGLMGFTLLGAPSLSQALEAKAFMERYADYAKSVGQPFTYGEVSSEGSNIRVKDPRWSIKDVPPMQAAEMNFSNVLETSGGGYSIGEISINGFSVAQKGFSVTFESSQISGVNVPGEGETDPYKKLFYYSQFVMNNLKVNVAGADVFTIAKTTADISPFNANSPMTMSLGTQGLVIDVTSIPSPQAAQSMQMLGYSGKFTGGISLDGTWSPADGTMDIATYDITIDNVGTLSVPMKFGGYTAEAVFAIQAKTAEINKMENPSERMMATMDLFKGLSFGGLTIRFTDDSITRRALKAAAKQLGQTPTALVQAVPFMLGSSLKNFPIPALKDKILSAVTQYVQDPKSIEISAIPNAPVGFSELMQSGMSNPFALVDLLNVDIQANQ